MTKPIKKSISETKLTERIDSLASICSMSSRSSVGDFKFTELFDDFVECNKKAKGYEVVLDNCSRIARHATDKNQKSFQSDKWTQSYLADAGHGRYSGK